MTISKGKTGPDPAMTVSNIKPPDVVDFVLYWTEDVETVTDRASFKLDVSPTVTPYKLRAIGHISKTKFRVDLVYPIGDGVIPWMSDDERGRLGRVLAKHLEKRTGLKVEPIKSSLFDHG